MFWLRIIKNGSNVFSYLLARIGIDETYLMTGWKKICKKFNNIKIFQLLFSKILIMAIIIIMTLNILKYIWQMLNLKILIYLYWKFLNHSNIMYTVTLITSSNFKDFNFLIQPKINSIDIIKKTMIFVHNIEKIRALIIYLQIFLPDKLKARDKDIIKFFSIILEIITKTDWLEKFLTSNSKIIIYIDAIGIEVLYIRYKVNYVRKIVNYYTLATIF